MEGYGVSHRESPEIGTGGLATYTILLISFLVPIFLMLCVFLYFIDTRILALTQASTSGRNDRDWRRWEEVVDEDMASPAAYSTDLLDDKIEDIRIQPLRPLSRSVSDENTPLLIEGPDGWLDGIIDNVKTPALQPKIAPRNPFSQHHTRDASPRPNTVTKRKAVPKAVMWDGKISWALKGASVFDDADEEYNAFRTRTNMLLRQPYSDLWVFQYGLRYIPSRSDSEVYRTIRIEELPSGITLGQILPLIVGEVYCARLTDTSAITGYNTAMIVFVTEDDTMKFLGAIAKKTAVLPFGKIVPVHTPTYPMPADIEHWIMEEGLTRSLAVYHSKPSLKAEITRVITHHHYKYSLQLEKIVDGPAPGEIVIKMFSVKGAAAVLATLKGHPTLANCRFRFLSQDSTHSQPQGTQGILQERDGF
ncbi:hypothetical protein BJY04DRAFT_215411 [Aspergillus karnatakaensis]|uniref:uncharacterized protein n=1 Tax=Aspergillus karnatakaensis TaxID=1810916 RepID=UPI003CCE1367